MNQTLARIKAALRRFPALVKLWRTLSAAPCVAPQISKQAHARAAQRALRGFLDGGGRLVFPRPTDPLLSIVIVIYNRAELTYLCLRALAQLSDPRCEVIVIDNASSDETTELLRRLGNVQCVRNEENVHFLRGSNQGAAIARAPYLLFLNNDTEVTAGSIDAALGLLESRDDIGAVGARLVFPDGRLQEAGSIIWRDGTCLGYGRGDNPEAPQYLFRREVDFCSGAFLLTRRSDFERLGGFDEAFAPAYYEEVDYCARLRELGRGTYYEPRALVRHYEFASTEASAEALALQRERGEIFRRRHPALLLGKLEPSSANVLRARTARERKHLLFIDERLPHVCYGAGYPRANEIVRAALELDWEVTVYPLCFVEPDETWETVYRDIPPAAEVIPFRPYWGDIERFLRERREHYDVIFLSRPTTMKEFRRRAARAAAGIPLIYDAEAIFTLREKLYAELHGQALPPQAWAKRIDAELALAEGVEAISTVSEREAAEFRGRGFSLVQVVSHSVPIAPNQPPFSQRTTILFVGAIHDESSPNADSVFWFLEQVFPRIATRLSGVEFVIAGLNRSPRLLSLKNSQVRVTGEVADLRAEYDRARVFVAPTRFLAGIPLKVIEAAAYGVPAVCSLPVHSALGWLGGEELLCAASPEEFAEQCIALYRNEALWRTVRDGARERVQREHSRAALQESLGKLLQQVSN